MKPLRQELVETTCLIAVLVAPAFRCFGDFTTNLVPVADTTLFETSPDINLGATPNFVAGNTANNFRDRALVKFDFK